MTSGSGAPDPQSFSPRSRAWTRFVAENGTMKNCDGELFSKKSIPYGSPRQGDRRKRTANGLSRFELFGKITTLTGNLHHCPIFGHETGPGARSRAETLGIRSSMPRGHFPTPPGLPRVKNLKFSKFPIFFVRRFLARVPGSAAPGPQGPPYA